MKKIVTLILFMLPLCLFAQSSELIGESLNKFRIKNGYNPIELDTLLCKVLTDLHIDSLYKLNGSYNKGEIRKVLQKHEVFDYNFEVVLFRIPKYEVNELPELLKKNNKILKILSKQEYNKLGYLYNNDSSVLAFIFSQNMIDFKEPSLIGTQKMSFPDDSKEPIYEEVKRNIKISGYIVQGDSLFYSFSKNGKKLKNLINSNEKRYENSDYFEIVIDVPTEPIEINFLDKNGEVKAIYLTPYSPKKSDTIIYPD
ncbi:MAG: hypothetical protein ACOCWM_03095 [Cyclobacteriaceae bacterium]